MFKNLFRQKNQSGTVSHIAMFEKIEQLLGEAAELANSNITDHLLKIQIRSDNTEESRNKTSSERRALLANAERALSLRATGGSVEIYLMPAAQALLIPESEYPSRIKFKLEESIVDGKPAWKLDDAEVDDAVLRLVVLASVNDLLREIKSFEKGELKLSVGEVSLSSAVRDLITDRNRLSSLLIQEQERIYRKLSMELHDDVLGDLMLLYRDLEAEHVDLAEVKTDLLAAMQKLRTLCNDLSSREVEDWGFRNALTELCQRNATRSGITIRLEGDNYLPELPNELSLQIYRIVQECLNNAMKHGDGSEIKVKIAQHGSEIQIRTVSCGSKQPFELSNQQTKLGLRIMHERAEIISSLGFPASLDVESDAKFWVITLFIDISRACKQS